jgi:hypothetical protein
MGYAAEVIADSIAGNGKRLFTVQTTYPRFIHAEVLTHRSLARNAASSRAIPVERMIHQVIDDPAMPVWWGKNQSGMQAKVELDEEGQECAKRYWLLARDEAVETARPLAEIGLHKQIVNRILEPWQWMTVIISATEWSNFFALRCHSDAQPEIQKIAYMMRDVYEASVPTYRSGNDWHLPYITEEERTEIPVAIMKQVSVARCARVSYLRQGETREIEKDIELTQKLSSAGHMSPFEHVAQPSFWSTDISGPFSGWRQYRKDLPNECR